MFCKWCGERMKRNTGRCPSCGRDQGALINGNGFWDLCSNGQPDHSGEPPTHIPMKSFRAAPWAVFYALLIIVLIIVMAIGIHKTEQCISENAVLKSKVYDADTLLTDCYIKLEEYCRTNQELLEALDIGKNNPQDGTEKNISIDLENLLDGSTEIPRDAEKLKIESYEIGTTPVKCLYLAVGEMPENQDAKMIWQISTDHGASWDTIDEDTYYIMVDLNELNDYRVVCLVESETYNCPIYYATTIDDSAVG